MSTVTLTRLLAEYGVSNPTKWVNEQRSIETPSHGQWEDGVFLIIASPNLTPETIEALLNYGIPLLDVKKLYDSPIRETAQGLIDGGRRLFEAYHLDKIPVINPQTLPRKTVLIFEQTSVNCLLTEHDCLSALLFSWENNPNREKAYEARKYLCDLAEKALGQ